MTQNINGKSSVFTGDGTAPSNEKKGVQFESDRAVSIPARFSQMQVNEWLARPWVKNVHPSYDSTLVEIAVETGDPSNYLREIQEWWKAIGSRNASVEASPLIKIPVCYEGEFALDLDDLVKETGMGRNEIIELHSSVLFKVAFFGFSPGFPYLEGLPEKLRVPRLKTPRTRVPAGSVAIAGTQAGVYPQNSPGGWRILGRTAMKLFDATGSRPSPLALGQDVQFYVVSRAEFDSYVEVRRD